MYTKLILFNFHQNVFTLNKCLSERRSGAPDNNKLHFM